jgi:hypothetical protein
LFKIILVYREPLRLQMKVFMDEVQQQLMLPTIRSVTGIETVKGLHHENIIYLMKNNLRFSLFLNTVTYFGFLAIAFSPDLLP